MYKHIAEYSNIYKYHGIHIDMWRRPVSIVVCVSVSAGKMEREICHCGDIVDDDDDMDEDEHV
jgi:hypothetical protein